MHFQVHKHIYIFIIQHKKYKVYKSFDNDIATFSLNPTIIII